MQSSWCHCHEHHHCCQHPHPAGCCLVGMPSSWHNFEAHSERPYPSRRLLNMGTSPDLMMRIVNMLIMMVTTTTIIILKTTRMRVTRMHQRGSPHVYRVGRLLNMWMRRRDPTQVLKGLPRSFPPSKICSPAVNCFAGKLETGQYCKLGRQEGFGLGISNRTRYYPSEGGEGGPGSVIMEQLIFVLKRHPRGSFVAVMLIFIIIMQIWRPAGKTDYCSVRDGSSLHRGG